MGGQHPPKNNKKRVFHMSNRIINTITISCVLLGVSTATASQKPITVEKIVKENQSYIVDYKDYPAARRSALTQHLLGIVDKDSSLSTKKAITGSSSEL
jgi:PhoPQ-activated pathogenicity-related protein